VAYLTRGRPDEVWLCTAVADLDGQVTQKSLATTCGGTNQVDRDFLLEASPLDQSGLPIPDCRFGPMGNVVLALTGRRITSAVVGVSSGQRIRMEPVPSSEAWPYGLFRGEVPPRRFVVGYELAVGSRQVGDRLPDRAAVPAAGCPALGG
jgi:hypothetical protein